MQFSKPSFTCYLFHVNGLFLWFSDIFRGYRMNLEFRNNFEILLEPYNQVQEAWCWPHFIISSHLLTEHSYFLNVHGLLFRMRYNFFNRNRWIKLLHVNNRSTHPEEIYKKTHSGKIAKFTKKPVSEPVAALIERHWYAGQVLTNQVLSALRPRTPVLQNLFVDVLPPQTSVSSYSKNNEIFVNIQKNIGYISSHKKDKCNTRKKTLTS